MEHDALLQSSSNDKSISTMSWFMLSLCGGCIYGANVSLAPWLPALTKTFHLSNLQSEILSASGTGMDALSMILGGIITDKYGRKPLLLLGCVSSILGGSMSVFSNCYLTLWIARCISGIGNGLTLLILPMYIGEGVSVSFRGFYLLMFQLG